MNMKEVIISAILFLTQFMQSVVLFEYLEIGIKPWK